MTQRWKLTLEYNGSPFVGWQHQDTGLSVQDVVEDAVFKFCGEKAVVTAAGRTDAGVHALGLVAHVDLERPATPDAIRGALNFHMLPHPVVVLRAEPVEPDFHARFSCVGRSYIYRIINRIPFLTLDQGKAWHVRMPLDIQAMQKAAHILIGHHDFSSFRDGQCQAKSPLRTLDVLEVARQGEEIRIRAEARSFLHHQVRNMVGTLKRIGEEAWPVEYMDTLLKARDRTMAGPTAPPEGLYFVEAKYK